MDLIRDYSLVFIFFVIPIIFVIQPLFLNKINNLENQIDIPSLERRKRLLYRQIKELEMEFDIGNVNQKDFEISRKELKVEDKTKTLQELDREKLEKKFSNEKKKKLN